MAGLLNQGMAPQQAPLGAQQPQGGPQQQQPQADAGVDANPEQAQAMYDALMEAMLGYLYDVGLADVQQALQAADNPTQGMARVIASIMTTTFHSLQQEGKTVPPGVMFQAGMELSKAVGEIAVKMQILPAKGNGEPIEAAFMMGLAQFGKAVGETALSEGQRQRYAEMIRTLRDLKQQHGQRGEQQPPAQQQPTQQPAQQPAPQAAHAQEVR